MSCKALQVLNKKFCKIMAYDLTNRMKKELESQGYELRHDSGIFFDVTGNEDSARLDELAFYIVTWE
jgi:hypothetical protein